MNIFQRIARGAEHTWAAYPLFGIMAIFAAIGLSVFYSYQAHYYARQAQSAVIGQIAAKDAVIAEKDTQLKDKDSQIQQRDLAVAGQVSVIGQLYNDAVALQQQVISLGGKPKTIPVTLPSAPARSPAGAAHSGPPPSQPVAVMASPVPPASPVPHPSGTSALDWHLSVQCPIICTSPAP